jgi:ABC-type branched-subunit amino acid transport system ATPase component
LTKGYGSMVAVDEVSFEVGRAEILGAAGRNGADKTTPVECRQELRRADQVNCGCWALTPAGRAGRLASAARRTVTFAVSVVHADRARLVFTPTGTGAA